jgi:hypothetical protein
MIRRENHDFLRRFTVGKNEKAVDFTELEKVLPPIVFRNWYHWRDVLPVAPRTVANDDSLGRGPKEKIMCGRVCGYPRNSLLDYLREKSRVIL